MDLACDLVARFGRSERMPPAFFGDWLAVAAEEAAHHGALAGRLRELGSFYGALPAHDGLWQSAAATAGSLRARLAVEHCTHEARGLDVLPQTVARLRAGGDGATAALLEAVVLPDEVAHCAKGVFWLKWLADRAHAAGGEGAGEGAGAPGCAPPGAAAAAFRADVAAFFRGTLKPPFNVAARDAAGFPPEWYAPDGAE